MLRERSFKARFEEICLESAKFSLSMIYAFGPESTSTVSRGQVSERLLWPEIFLSRNPRWEYIASRSHRLGGAMAHMLIQSFITMSTRFVLRTVIFKRGLKRSNNQKHPEPEGDAHLFCLAAREGDHFAEGLPEDRRCPRGPTHTLVDVVGLELEGVVADQKLRLKARNMFQLP